MVRRFNADSTGSLRYGFPLDPVIDDRFDKEIAHLRE
jgi:hypothetical protein